MFKNAKEFNIGVFGDAAETAKITDMSSMFEGATKYNTASLFETGLVTTMVNMFKNAEKFNQGVTTATATWKVENVQDMTSMFEGAIDFTGTADLSWVTTDLVKANSMFKGAVKFAQDVFVSGSDTAKVTDMASMFEGATLYNSAEIGFYTDKVTSMNSMFKNAAAFDKNIGVVTATAEIWNVGNVLDMTSMFEGAVAYDNNNGDATQNINSWNVAKVTSFTNMFKGAILYNKTLSGWSVDSGTNFNDMFNGATAFKRNLCAWQAHGFVSSETNSGTFSGTTCPNQTVNADSDQSTGDVCCSCVTGNANVCVI